jgi:alpha-ketoglutarate-dependent taurine dioxygenase
MDLAYRQYGLRLRPHDVVLWDNRCTPHARTDFSAAEHRLMRRLTILGEKPLGSVRRIARRTCY